MELGGVYREIVRSERLVYTQRIDGCDAQGSSEALITTTFVEHQAVTTFTSTVLYPSRETRDAVLKSGVKGIDAVYDKLADLLACIITRESVR
jgi:uncharacterized protein YndB with AHSA1/START domain